MALIECPDCGKQISDSATSCIGCGRPLRDADAAVVEVGNNADKPVLIEASARRYKRNMLIGLAGIPVGFIVAMIGGGATISGLVMFGFLIIFAGIVWFLLNAVVRWYHHA